MNWKKKDAVLILTVLLIAGAAFGVHEFAGGDGADTVTVKVDGKVTGTYPLAKDQKIRINGGTNILTIKNGKAKMTDADCPDQLCVHQKAASKNHESIICLPNKVVVEVDGADRLSCSGRTSRSNTSFHSPDRFSVQRFRLKYPGRTPSRRRCHKNSV